MHHRQFLLGELRRQKFQNAELAGRADEFHRHRVQAAGRKTGVLHQRGAHQRFAHAVPHKGQRQRGKFAHGDVRHGL